jgi:hypothetical protein
MENNYLVIRGWGLEIRKRMFKSFISVLDRDRADQIDHPDKANRFYGEIIITHLVIP